MGLIRLLTKLNRDKIKMGEKVAPSPFAVLRVVLRCCLAAVVNLAAGYLGLLLALVLTVSFHSKVNS